MFGDAEGDLLPAGKGLDDGLDFAIAGVLRGDLLDGFAVDFVADHDGNLSEFVEHIELGDDQPLGAVDHVGVAQAAADRSIRSGAGVR